MFLNLRHNSEHVDIAISGPGQPQQNKIFMFLKIHERRIALWARFSGDILQLVNIVIYEEPQLVAGGPVDMGIS